MLFPDDLKTEAAKQRVRSSLRVKLLLSQCIKRGISLRLGIRLTSGEALIMAEQYLTSDAVGLLENKMKDTKAADLPYHYRGRLTVASAVLETSGELPKVKENLSRPPRGLLSRWIQRWKVNRLQKEARRTAEGRFEQIEREIRDTFRREQYRKRRAQAEKEAIEQELRRYSKVRAEIFRCAELFQSAQRKLRVLGLQPDLAEEAQARLEALFKHHLELLSLS